MRLHCGNIGLCLTDNSDEKGFRGQNVATTEREMKEWLGAHSQIIEGFLRQKGADKPCHRCGNNHFLVPEENLGPIFVSYCSNCGAKNEYLVSILIDTESEE